MPMGGEIMGDEASKIVQSLNEFKFEVIGELARIKERLFNDQPLCGVHCAQHKASEWERRIKELEEADKAHRLEHDGNRRWINKLIVGNIIVPVVVALVVYYLTKGGR